MFSKMMLGSLLLASTSLYAAAGELETVQCATQDAADQIVASALAEPSLEDGAGEQTIALINGFLETGVCEKIVLDDSATQAADQVHPEGGVAFGVIEDGGKYAVAMNFANDLF